MVKLFRLLCIVAAGFAYAASRSAYAKELDASYIDTPRVLAAAFKAICMDNFGNKSVQGAVASSSDWQMKLQMTREDDSQVFTPSKLHPLRILVLGGDASRSECSMASPVAGEQNLESITPLLIETFSLSTNQLKRHRENGVFWLAKAQEGTVVTMAVIDSDGGKGVIRLIFKTYLQQ